MDPIQIILVIAACIGGLLLLAFIIWAIAATLIFRNAKKTFREVDNSFKRDFHRDFPKFHKR